MSSDNAWQPSASVEIIKKRAKLLQQIREFMNSREITEVDTPILSHYGISDPYIQSMTTTVASEKNAQLYLQTSPELCMKRLLAAGMGSIYQLAHVFRNEESGKRHSSEFSMLEWYRLGFDYHELMNEVGELLQEVGLESPEKMTYAQSFLVTTGVDPHITDTKKMRSICKEYGWETEIDDQHVLLDYVFSEVVMKNIKQTRPLFIYDYPRCMSALATLKHGSPVVSERFELFIGGMEIANGFNELVDADEQLTRFESDLQTRRNRKLAEPPIDKNFLTALEYGLPKCSGVAVGIDRLLMVLSGKNDIKDVTTFTLDAN